MASVFLEPIGRNAFELKLTDVPEYSERAKGGYAIATIACVLDTHRDRIIDARVRIFPVKGPPWIGRVASVRQRGPVAELTCTGPQADLARFRREVAYCHTAFSEWRERLARARDQRIRLAQTHNGWSCCWLQGTTYAAWSANGIILDIPATDACRLEFDWTRVNQTDYRFAVFASAVYDDGAGGSWGTAIYTQPVGSGGTTGTAVIDVSKSGVKQLLIFMTNAVDVTPARMEIALEISDIKVYGVPGLTAVTVPAVIHDVCDNLPSWVIPPGPEARAWIGADAVLLEPLVFDANASELDILDEALSYRDYDGSFRSKLIGDAYHPVIVYEPRSTTPSYQMFPEMPGVLELTGDDITAMTSAVRVMYLHADGRSRYIDVTELSEDNRLVTLGRVKMDVIQVNIRSTATATMLGQRYLAERRLIRVAGTATIEGPIVDFAGAEVLPCEVEAGKSIRLQGTPYGTVDCRIVEVVKRGDYYARMSLDNTPTALDAELALLRKRVGR